MTHRMAQWAAAALATDGLDPRMVFRLVKKVYEHRSNIVHGRSARRDQIKVGKRRSALRTWVSTSCGRSL
jgi:hypothetical protein